MKNLIDISPEVCAHCAALFEDGQRVIRDDHSGDRFCSIRCAAIGLGLPGADEIKQGEISYE